MKMLNMILVAGAGGFIIGMLVHPLWLSLLISGIYGMLLGGFWNKIWERFNQ